MLMIFSHVRALMTLASLLYAACSAATANSDGSGPQPPSPATVTVTSYLMGGSVMPDTISPVSGIPAETVSGTRRPDACVTENVSASFQVLPTNMAWRGTRRL
jgi:hypothetical protein